MICSRKPSRHKPSKKPPNLREQTVARGASLGKSPEALLSKGRLAATTSRQKRPSPSRDACSHLPAKEENREDRRSGPPRPRQILDRHLSPSPLSLLLVPRLRHLGGYQPPKQTSPHCRAGQIAEAIWKGLRPSHRRGFRLAIYSWPAPTLANFNHLADRRGRADKARTTAPGTGSLSPASRELPSLVANINSQFTSVGDVIRRFA